MRYAKRVIALALLLVLFASSTLAENNYDSARALANFMEDHYCLTILIGPECDNLPVEGFTLGHTASGRTPFLNLLAGTGQFNYESEMERIDDCFSVYPPGFFSRFRCDEAPEGLRILLPDQILADDSYTVAGVTTIADGYYNVFLGVGAFNDLNVHHEIWHAMEYRITAEEPGAFDGWDSLNPEGFSYDEAYFETDIWMQAQAKDEWFVRGYSTVNEMEDRATAIEAVFSEDVAWWKEHPYIAAKLEKMMEAMEPVFGENVYYHE